MLGQGDKILDVALGGLVDHLLDDETELGRFDPFVVLGQHDLGCEFRLQESLAVLGAFLPAMRSATLARPEPRSRRGLAVADFGLAARACLGSSRASLSDDGCGRDLLEGKTRAGMSRGVAGEDLPPPDDRVDIQRIQLQPEASAPHALGRHQRGAATQERVQYRCRRAPSSPVLGAITPIFVGLDGLRCRAFMIWWSS